MRGQIAKEWNMPASGSGYVIKFEVQNVGGDIHNELRVPAEELKEFNGNIAGLIEVTKIFR